MTDPSEVKKMFFVLLKETSYLYLTQQYRFSTFSIFNLIRNPRLENKFFFQKSSGRHFNTLGSTAG